MISKQRDQTDGEHTRSEEQEQDVEFAITSTSTILKHKGKCQSILHWGP